MGDDRYPLLWIDEYVRAIRDHVVVRETDALLIKLPNEAYRLNRSGVRTMKFLIGGGGVLELWRAAGGTEEVRRDLYTFFVGIKQVLQGCLDEHRLPDSVASRPFALGFSSLPVLSEVALTYRCNLRCRFCYAGRTCVSREGDEREMTIEEVKDVLGVIRRDAEVPSVSFTGGEPTLRDGLDELIAHARRELGLRVNLITNGTLIDGRRAERLARAGLHSAQVSIEGPDPATHDGLTQVAGSFERSAGAVRALKEHGIHVHTNTTINRENLAVAHRMPALARELGLSRLSMNVVIPVGSSARADPDITVRYEELPAVLDRTRQEAVSCGVEFMWYSPTPICIFNPIPRRLGNKGCSACDGLLSVSPSGDVLPCSSWAEPVGNLLREGFGPVWSSARSTALRRKSFAHEMCRGCEDFALCQGACPLYWSHFGYEELERHGADYVAAAR